jgi:hypothetical protein
MRNFNNAFHKKEGSFLSQLELTEIDKKKISEAVTEIKSSLQIGISKEYQISPRFMTQGSARYKTLNTPCMIPPQQMDHDIGCYLPLSSHMEDKKPKQASNHVFATADRILEALVKEKKWNSYSKEKDTCCRVELNDRIHIDIPLYSVPDDEFKTIRERMDKSIESAANFSDYREESWDDFKFENVVLARRSEGWKVSDPRKLNQYFEDIVDRKGEQIRRLFRYVKAFRDKQWKTKGPSSIFLMCVVDSLIQQENKDGDDLALLDILKGFSELTSRHITNPTDPTEQIPISSSEKDFQLLKQKSQSFYADFKNALEDDSITGIEASKLIQQHLGDRFPVKDVPFDDDRLRNIVFSKEPTQAPHISIPPRTRAG